VRLLIRILIVVFCSGNLLGVFAQNEVRSGFVIVTPVSGNAAGLIVRETLINRSATVFESAIVPPSVLTTSASMLVTVEPIRGGTTGIAIANPSMISGGVNLILTNAAGDPVLDTVIPLGPRQQVAQFISELFGTTPLGFTTPLLMTVSSEIPVAILGLDFQGDSFVSVPLTSLSFPSAVPVQPLTPLGPEFPTFESVPFIPQLQPPGSFVSDAPTIGGPASVIFPQVAAGGNWATEIAIGNVTTGTQVVRIDFFNENGVNIGSLSDVTIRPRGVFHFSTDIQAVGIQ